MCQKLLPELIEFAGNVFGSWERDLHRTVQQEGTYIYM